MQTLTFHPRKWLICVLLVSECYFYQSWWHTQKAVFSLQCAMHCVQAVVFVMVWGNVTVPAVLVSVWAPTKRVRVSYLIVYHINKCSRLSILGLVVKKEQFHLGLSTCFREHKPRLTYKTLSAGSRRTEWLSFSKCEHWKMTSELWTTLDWWS